MKKRGNLIVLFLILSLLIVSLISATILSDIGKFFQDSSKNSLKKEINNSLGELASVGLIGRSSNNPLPKKCIQDTLGIYDPATSTFYLKNSFAGLSADQTFAYGTPNAGWIPLVGDWNRDGRTGAGLYDPKTSIFYLTNSFGNYAEVQYAFGISGSLPLIGDWNGDGYNDIGLYAPNSSWFYLKNGPLTSGYGYADYAFGYGVPKGGWIPLVGDWDGDGKTGVALYDPKSSVFYITNKVTTGYAEYSFGYGAPNAGWIPISGDWNGDGKTGVGLYDPKTSTFYLTNNLATGYAEKTFPFGAPGWTPIIGDWNGDGKTGVGLYDGATFYLSNNFNSYADVQFTYRVSGTGVKIPIVGDWDVNCDSSICTNTAKCGSNVCFRSNGNCGQCYNSNDCNKGDVCKIYSCSNYLCSESLKCAGNTPYCFGGNCYNCTSDSQCKYPIPYCSSIYKKCVSCYLDSQCSGGVQDICKVNVCSIDTFGNGNCVIVNKCSGATPYCSYPLSGLCVACLNDGNCGTGKKCVNNQCMACTQKSDCGTDGYTGSPVCQGNSIYQNYITWSCNNAGTTSSTCTSVTNLIKKSDCPSVTPFCNNGNCVKCISKTNCGTDGYIGNVFCIGNSIYQNYTTWTCNNAGTVSSSCSNVNTTSKKSDCTTGQSCSGGTCFNVACFSKANCPSDGYTGNPICQNGNVYQNYITYSCINPGTASSSCSNTKVLQLKQNCGTQTCSAGSCVNKMNTAYYSFEGNANDISGNGNHAGAFGGAISTDNGKVGKAYSFDGSSGYMVTGSSSNSWTTLPWISVGFWMNPRQTGSTIPGKSSIILGDTDAPNGVIGNSWFFEYWQDGTINWLLWGSPAVSSSNKIIDLDKWYYVVGIYDGSFQKLYINGKLVSSVANSQNIYPGPRKLYIGSGLCPTEWGCGNRFFNGTLDEIKIYNYALTENQISSEYERGKYSINGCDVLDIPDKTYTLGSNLNNPYSGGKSSCINITARNVTFDCDLKSIISSKDIIGVYSNQADTKIYNCSIKMGSNGIGIQLEGTNSAKIINNVLSGQGTGLNLVSAINSEIKNNHFNSNQYGLRLSNPSNNYIALNIACFNNLYNFYCEGGNGDSGDDNLFRNDYGPRKVQSCDSGWPEEEIDYRSCPQSASELKTLSPLKGSFIKDAINFFKGLF